MVIASIVLGVLFIIGGIYCMSAPASTYLTVMRLFASLLLVYGIFGIIRFFKRRSLVPEFIASIAAVIIGFVYLFRPGNTPAAGNLLGLDRIVLFLTAAWFLLKGCISVYYSVKTRFYNNRWIYGFISGVLSVILGVYSFMYPSMAAASIGVLVGMWMIQCGIDFVTLGTTIGFIQGTIEEVEREVQETVEEVRSAARNYAEERNARANQASENVTPAEDAGPVEIPIEDPEKPE